MLLERQGPNFEGLTNTVVPRFLRFQNLLVGFGFDSGAQVCAGRIAEKDSGKECGQDLWIGAVLGGMSNDLSEEGRHIIENKLVVKRQLRHELFALKIILR